MARIKVSDLRRDEGGVMNEMLKLQSEGAQVLLEAEIGDAAFLSPWGFYTVMAAGLTKRLVELERRVADLDSRIEERIKRLESGN